MNEFSLIDKFNILIDIISESPFFLFCIMLEIAVLIFFLITIKNDEKINKWVIIGFLVALFIVIIIVYNSVVLNLFDNLIDGVFMALYFPNLIVYLIILFISNFYFILTFFKKRILKSRKILNIVNGIIINVFLIIIVDIVKSNGIDVYNELTVYSNSYLLVTLELNSAIFTSWILLHILISAHNKLKKYDKKEYPKMQEIIFDE